MPCRKKYTLSAKGLSIYEMIVGELSKNPELAANYDMATIEISVLKTIEPFIKNIDAVISHFEWYLAKNKKNIPIFSGEEIINRILLAKMLGISRQTLSDWIRKGFITPVKSQCVSNKETFSTKAVLKQLKRYQAEHGGK
ncbi:hypothetical protein EZS27_016161 [termite gut metagenome]|uniref:Helix-turn-helix domain-containing protein n=1 Tax=termite gut metagenome TaxID=433724 RepID=A0A5J4RPP0_9ZZZZ